MNKGSLPFFGDIETVFSHILVGIAPKAVGRGEMVCLIVQNPLFYADGTENTGEIFVGSGSNYIYSMIPGQESPYLYAEDLKDVYIKLKFPFPNPNGGALTASVADVGEGYTIGDVLTITPASGNVATVEVLTNDGRVLTVALGDPGVLYAPGDTIFLNGGNPLARIIVDTVDGFGAILTFHISVEGLGYAPGIVATTTLGAGANATFDILTVSEGIGSVAVLTPGTGFVVGDEYAATGGTGVEGVIEVESVETVTPETADVNLLIYRRRKGGKQ